MVEEDAAAAAAEPGRRSSRPAPSLRRSPWSAVLAEVKEGGKGAAESSSSSSLGRGAGGEGLEVEEGSGSLPLSAAWAAGALGQGGA